MGLILEIIPISFPGLRHACRQISCTMPAACLLITCCVVIMSYSYLTRKNQRLVPGVLVVGGNDKPSIKKNRERFRTNAKEMLQEGYQKTAGGFFYVPSPLGERLMIPLKYLEELKSAPVEHVDFVGTFIEMFEGKYTTMGSRSTLHPRVIKAQLNQHLADVIPAVQDEIEDSFRDLFPKCHGMSLYLLNILGLVLTDQDWTPVPVVDLMTKIVARVSSRMFGGTTLSHNEKWLDASVNFALDGFTGAQKLKQYPEFLKPFVSRYLPEIQRIASYYAVAEDAAIPLLQNRERTKEKAVDLLYWMAEQAEGDEKQLKFLAGILLKVSFAAIHTSAAAPSQLIFDLCAHPEITEPLRQELDSVCDVDGRIDKPGFRNMAKMDSFMKESQRFNPLLLITFERIIHAPFTLSSGFTIPADTTIGIPTQAVTMDSSLYPNPEKFDAFRFSDLRATKPELDGRLQYVASNASSMSFGYGRHACPGRFFAAQEIKAIMSFILREYDMRFSEGQTRPQSFPAETQFLPNLIATVEFKKRRSN